MLSGILCRAGTVQGHSVQFLGLGWIFRFFLNAVALARAEAVCRRCHICAGTGLARCHICARTGLSAAHICAGTRSAAAKDQHGVRIRRTANG